MSKSSYINFTKHTIEELPLPEKKGAHLRFFDLNTRGLYILITHGGARTFYARRKIQGKSERFCIGRYPDISIEQARTRAMEFQSKLSYAQNLAAVRREQNKEITLGELFDQYLEKHLKRNSKRWMDIQASFDRGFSHWKSRRLSVISAEEVLELHQSIAEKRSPLTANRAVEILRAMYNKAIKWRIYRGENPATIVTMFPETIRSRVLEEHEFESFISALEAEPDSDMRDFFMLALQTGVRRANLLSMRWDDINLDAKTWLIPKEKTKTGDPYLVALTIADVQILKARKKNASSEYVFPGSGTSGHMVDPKRAWARIIKRAGLSNFRIHDLRRSMATLMANTGANAALIQGAMNHRDIKTTLTVYAHSGKNAEREAKELAQKVFLNRQTGHSNVVAFRKRQSPGRR